MPVHDWQFWVVSLGVLLAAAWLFRGVLPVPILSRRHRRGRTERRATLTVGGKAASLK